MAFRVLGAGNFPAHRTICDFRGLHLEELQALFVQVVGVARELGLVKPGVLGVDGTKIRANASKHKAMSYGRMREEQARLKAEIGELLKRAERLDRAEDERFAAQAAGEALPEELKRREDRLFKIEAAKARLEARQREADRERGRHEDDGRKPTKGDGRGSRFKLVALGREGSAALRLDAECAPASARMAQKLNTAAGRAATGAAR